MFKSFNILLELLDLLCFIIAGCFLLTTLEALFFCSKSLTSLVFNNLFMPSAVSILCSDFVLKFNNSTGVTLNKNLRLPVSVFLPSIFLYIVPDVVIPVNTFTLDSNFGIGKFKSLF